jgi:hypothetical protein
MQIENFISNTTAMLSCSISLGQCLDESMIEIVPFQVYFDQRFATGQRVPGGLRDMRVLLNSLTFQPNMVVAFTLGTNLTDVQKSWLELNSNGPYLYDEIKRIYFSNGMAALLFYLQFYDEMS